MREVADFLKANDAYFLLGLSLLSLVLLVCTLSLARKIGRISRRRNAKLTGDRVGDIVDCLTDQQVALERLEEQLRDTQSKQSEQAVTLAGCLKNVGVVRFNAFWIPTVTASRSAVSTAGRIRVFTPRRS
jgi:hypothetical protein